MGTGTNILGEHIANIFKVEMKTVTVGPAQILVSVNWT